MPYSGLDSKTDPKGQQTRLLPLPHALDSFEHLLRFLEGREPAVFLDYDGTLTPIVDTPDQALLAPEVRRTLVRLTTTVLTGIISGRDLHDVRHLVQVEGLLYAGSHGFDIQLPEGRRIQPHPPSQDLDQAEQDLRLSLGDLSGIMLERKRFSLAIHFRLASEAEEKEMRRRLKPALALFSSLRFFEGKKVIEVQPDLEWDKGQALLHVLQQVAQPARKLFPLYLGDDTTDETAFAVLKTPPGHSEKHPPAPPEGGTGAAHCGLGICVGDEDRLTWARFRLKDPQEVHTFLQRFTAWMQETGAV